MHMSATCVLSSKMEPAATAIGRWRQHRRQAGEGGAHVDAESRMRLRSIDVQLLKILEEMAAGRTETTADLRADLTTLTAAVRQLGRAR